MHRFGAKFIHSSTNQQKLRDLLCNSYGKQSTQRTDYSWFKVDKDGTGDVLSSSSLGEKGVERVVTTSDGLVTGHLSIRLDSMLQAVQFPAGITDLNTGLSNVDRDALTLKSEQRSPIIITAVSVLGGTNHVQVGS